MDWLATLITAVALAMDAFAVSLGIGTTQVANSPRPVFRISFHMGFFKGLMTLLGWLAGTTIARLISAVDHWVALGLLAFVGVRMIRSGFDAENNPVKSDPSHGITLVILSLAVSIDAMAVGLGMAMLDTPIVAPSIIIAAVSLGFSLLGLRLGNRLGIKFGKRMEILGGALLIAIGLRILFTHLF